MSQPSLFGEDPLSTGSIQKDVDSILHSKPGLDHKGVMEEMIALHDLAHIKGTPEYDRIMNLLVNSPHIERECRRWRLSRRKSSTTHHHDR